MLQKKKRECYKLSMRKRCIHICKSNTFFFFLTSRLSFIFYVNELIEVFESLPPPINYKRMRKIQEYLANLENKSRYQVLKSMHCFLFCFLVTFRMQYCRSTN